MGHFALAFILGYALISMAFGFCYLYGTSAPNPSVVYYGFFVGVGFGALGIAVLSGLKDML